MSLRDGVVSPDLLREIALGLRHRARLQDRTLLGTIRRNEMSLDAHYLERMAAKGGILHTLVGMPMLPELSEGDEPRTHTWPRLEDGRDGGR